VSVVIDRPPGCPLTYAGSQAVEGMLAGLEGDFVVRVCLCLLHVTYVTCHVITYDRCFLLMPPGVSLIRAAAVINCHCLTLCDVLAVRLILLHRCRLTVTCPSRKAASSAAAAFLPSWLPTLVPLLTGRHSFLIRLSHFSSLRP
jgi:hypothetical protein